MASNKDIFKGYAKTIGSKKKEVIKLLNDSGYPIRKDAPVKDVYDKALIYFKTDDAFAQKFLTLTGMSFKNGKFGAFTGSIEKIIYGPGNTYRAADGSESVVSTNGYGEENPVIQNNPVMPLPEVAPDVKAVRTALASMTPEDKLVMTVAAQEESEKNKGISGLSHKYPMLTTAVLAAGILVLAYVVVTKVFKIKLS